MKKVKLFTLVLFLGGIALPGLGLVLFTEGEKKSENQLPPLQLRNAGEWFRQMDAFFAENFWGRTELFHGYSQIKYKTGISPLPHKLVLGQDGWMFLGNSFKDGLYRSSGLKETSAKELHQLDSLVSYRSHWLEKRGTPYHFFIAPSKATVYPEELPASLADTQTQSRGSKLENYFGNSRQVHLLAQALQPHKNEEILYFRYDSHWNAPGAWYAFEAMMSELDLSTVKDLQHYDLKKKVRKKGDLLQLTDLSLGLSEINYPFTLSPQNIPYFQPFRYRGRGDYLTTENSDALYSQKVLILTDSFGAALQPYITDHFKTVHFASAYDLPKELVEKLKPDLVLQVVVERELTLFN